MAAILLRYVSVDRSRHGRIRYYYRVPGRPRVRLPDAFGTPEFMAAYAAAAKGELSPAAPRKPSRPPPGTFHAACIAYFESPRFQRLAPKTQRLRRRFLDAACEKAGAHPLAAIDRRAIQKAVDKRSATPHQARALLKTYRDFFGFCLSRDLVQTDPSVSVEAELPESEGFHTWTREEIAAFQDHHPVGTRARLAFDLLLYTGQRRGDVVTFGRQHLREGALVLRQGKTGEPLEIPILPPLAASLAHVPAGQLTFLITHFGRPFTSNGFGNWFRECCNAAGLPGCSAHGLRKAGATIAAENGATENQLRAIFGWRSGKQAVHYTRKANQRLLARGAMHLVDPAHKENELVAPEARKSAEVRQKPKKREVSQ